jgi:tetratricopeptide (TPR) repeat protein
MVCVSVLAHYRDVLPFASGGGLESNVSLVTGTFVNPNHAGTLLSMALLAALGLTLGSRGLARGTALLLVVVTGSGLLLTLSRGALGAALVALLLFLGHSAWRWGRQATRTPEKDVAIGLHLAKAVGFGAVVLIAVVGLVALALHRFGTWRAILDNFVSAAESERKLAITGTALSAVPDFPFGIGADSFSAISRALVPGLALDYRFVECDPVEIVLAYGLPVAGAVAVLSIRWFVGLTRPAHVRPPMTQPELALTYGLVAFSLSSLVSFNIEILGLVLPALVVADLVSVRRGARGVRRLSRLPTIILLSVCILAGAAAYAIALDMSERQSAVMDLVAASRSGDQAHSEDVDRVSLEGVDLLPTDGHQLGHVSLLLQLSKREGPSELTMRRALAIGERAIELGEGDPTGHLAVARAANSLGRKDRAASAYRSASERLETVPPSLVTEVLGAFPTALTRANALPAQPARAGVFVRALEARGKASEALEMAVEYQALHTEDPEAANLVVVAAISAGEPVLAELHARNIIASFPESPSGYLAASASLSAQKRYRAAVEVLGEGIRRSGPRDLRFRRAQLISWGSPNLLPEFRQELVGDLKAGRADGRLDARAHAFYLSGALADLDGEHERAGQYYEQALRLMPDAEVYKKAAMSSHRERIKP